MQKVGVLIAFVFFSLILSCSAPVRSVTMPEYNQADHLDANILGVMIDTTQIKILNESSLFDDFGKGKSDTMFINILKVVLPEAINQFSSFKKTYFFPYNKAAFSYQKTMQFPSGDTISIKFPSEEMSMKSHSVNPDYMLFLQNLRTSEIVTTSYNAITFTTTGSRYLNIYSRFVIWDNRERKIVSYGDAEGVCSVFLEMTPDTWHKAIKRMIKHILKNTPFKR